MQWSTAEVAEVRELIGALLEALGLDAYLFEVEPLDDAWELRLECAPGDGWQSFRLPLEAGRLRAARTDRAQRERLLGELDRRLAGCKRGPGAG